ncbi:hypothetical protein AB0M45_21185 [Nocardia sp. NPDC051787]|uniref:hypothetical protein n=1 Tax=Nocardia sp. NPDC051787 TaxID=3155415 RepID=UPI0034430071
MAGSALLVLGSATGSGFGSFGSSLIGPGSSLIGPGSNGSALGSAAVGSAATGSALLTCLLLIPAAPPVPMNPLQLGPPAPGFIPFPATAITQTPLFQAEQPLAEVPPKNRQRPRDLKAAEPTADPIAWNLMKLMTILVVTVLTIVRVRMSPSPRRTN